MGGCELLVDRRLRDIVFSDEALVVVLFAGCLVALPFWVADKAIGLLGIGRAR